MRKNENPLPKNSVYRKILFHRMGKSYGRCGSCDAAVIATLDNQHAGPAMACLNRGWHVLLEKPLADKFQDCRDRKPRKPEKSCCSLSHPQVYGRFRMVKQILEKGVIGS